MTKTLYNVRWTGPDGQVTANVSFYAADDVAARKQVEKLAREVDRTRSSYTLYAGPRIVYSK